MQNIKHWLDIVDQNRDHIALGLMSDPGLSKTAQINQWAEEHGRKVVEIILSQRMPSEISGMPMPVDESKTMEIYDFNLLLNLNDGDILFLDEFTNGNIQTLNATLTLIQDRVMLSGKKLPSLLIVAAGNPQGQCDLLPQTKQRFLWINVLFDSTCWKNYMLDKWSIRVNRRVTDHIQEQYRKGFNSKEYNYVTPRSVENLFRIAKTIDKQDELWNRITYSSNLIDAIYDCLKNESKLDSEDFSSAKGSIYNIIMQDSSMSFLTLEVNKCKTMNDLIRFVTACESGQRGDGGLLLIKLMKENIAMEVEVPNDQWLEQI